MKKIMISSLLPILVLVFGFEQELHVKNNNTGDSSKLGGGDCDLQIDSYNNPICVDTCPNTCRIVSDINGNGVRVYSCEPCAGKPGGIDPMILVAGAAKKSSLQTIMAF